MGQTEVGCRRQMKIPISKISASGHIACPHGASSFAKPCIWCATIKRGESMMTQSWDSGSGEPK